MSISRLTINNLGFLIKCLKLGIIVQQLPRSIRFCCLKYNATSSGMKISPFCLVPSAAALLSGCYSVRQQAYYVSPFNSHQNDYQPLPQTIDSAHTALYVHAAFSAGGANQERTDHVDAFRTSISVAHHTGILQAYYGGDLTLGAYHSGIWDTGHVFWGPRTLPPGNADYLNSESGDRFFGGVGFKGGANLVWGMEHSEWRYIGIETSLQQEFGDYLTFRRKLPDTAAALIIRNPLFATLGFSTEIVKRLRQGEWGLRLASGWVLGDGYRNSGIYDNESEHTLHYGYASFSFHYTQQRYTGYLQLTGATQARSLSIGVHYRLTRPRNAGARYVKPLLTPL
jgi:hypothetical protein